MDKKKKRLITSALPYVNNIPHLGNLIQLLSADVFARYCRKRGYETLYVCGTDEYGTATETRALAEGISPKALCDRFHDIHVEIYKWFNIAFDHFGRTSDPQQTLIVQHIFKKVYENGYITQKSTKQLFCNECNRFLADRYVLGTCPHCGYNDARGDQCESCGKLLDPIELINPRCGSCNHEPVVKETNHLYIDLPAILPLLEQWMNEASTKGFWAHNAVAMTKSWIRDGLKERCITRDLKWGIPVPLKGFEDKVFYVWFDAPIGYISISATHTQEWKKWWQNPSEVELFQFIGKDNIPFHTVLFPSSLLATKEPWTMLHHISSTEYLNYENTKFSKSKGTGVFGNDAKETGIDVDIWRFYIFYNRPEKTDVQFTWKDFQEKVNGELIGNFGNLVNRTLTFVNKFYQGVVPDGQTDKELRAKIDSYIKKVDYHFDHANLRDALHTILEISDLGNKAFQAGEPWRMRQENPDVAKSLIRTLVYLIRDLAILIEPFIPSTAATIAGFCANASLEWGNLGKENFSTINAPHILFNQLEDDKIAMLRARYGGQNQGDGQEGKPSNICSSSSHSHSTATDNNDIPLEKRFAKDVALTVGKIIEIDNHPQADRLYVEKIAIGNDRVIQVVSGLVSWYKKEELLGKQVVVVENLKPTNLRGVRSEAMVLAASLSQDDNSALELLFVDDEVPLGTSILIEGYEDLLKPTNSIKIDHFFAMPITVSNYDVMVGDSHLICNGKKMRLSNIQNGVVG